MIRLLFFVLIFGVSLNVSAQIAEKSGKLNVEKVLMLLPDSCFKVLNHCLHDSTAFLFKNRYKIIDTISPAFAKDLIIQKRVNRENDFIINATTCKYSTTMKYTWWQLEPAQALIVVVTEEVDMCTERQKCYFYEYSETTGALKSVQSLPKINISDFVTTKTLGMHKINPSTDAPVFLSWNGSDTITVSIETAPYRNCADSYPDSPFIKLKSKDYYRNEIGFYRRGKQFVKCKKN